MKAPKNIAEIAEKYETLKKEADRIEKEIEACRKAFIEWKGDPGVYVGHLFIADEPNGDEQNDGEYCDQWRHGEDWYTGTYYYPIEGSNKYVAYTYESSIINY